MSQKLSIITRDCEYCQKSFNVPYNKRKKQFCSRSCAVRSAKCKNQLKSLSVCVVCEKEFHHHGEKVVCSKICANKYMCNQQVGANNPALKEEKNEAFQCKNCGGSFVYQPIDHDISRQYCSRLCWKLFQQEKKIVENDDKCELSQCALCGICSEEISVHHIDYDSTNCGHENLICLCKKCRELTDFQKGFWEVLFTTMMSGSKMVRKDWGLEIHIVNNQDYCLKYLVFFAGTHFSHHYHEAKKEAWHCLMGEFDMLLESQDSMNEELSVFRKGDKVQIERGVIHQLRARKNSILVEVSTQSFAEDSFKDRNIIPIKE